MLCKLGDSSFMPRTHRNVDREPTSQSYPLTYPRPQQSHKTHTKTYRYKHFKEKDHAGSSLKIKVDRQDTDERRGKAASQLGPEMMSMNRDEGAAMQTRRPTGTEDTAQPMMWHLGMSGETFRRRN